MDLIINYLILQANIRKNTSLKTQKIRIKKSWEKCFLYGGCLLQYHCIKTAGVATFGKPRSFEKKLKNFRAKYILSQKSAFFRAWIRAVKRQILTDAKLRGANPPHFCQDARMLKPIIAPQAPRVAGDFTQPHSCTFAGGNISFNSAAIIIKLILRRIPTALSLRCIRRPFCRPFCLSLPACAAP